MSYRPGEKKEIYQTIFDENAFPFGEYLVIPRDVLMRFARTEARDLPNEIAGSFEKILTETLHFFPTTGGREDIKLSIPMGHRYTKFVYVVDPFVIYMPYHYHIPELYGIYFRENMVKSDLHELLKLTYTLLLDRHFYERLRIPNVVMHDIQAILKHPALFNGIVVALYFESLYMHALAHHVLEDVSTWYEINKMDHYSVIRDSKMEEAFCEYIMFLALKGEAGWNEPKGGYALRVLYNLRDVFAIPPISPDYLMRFIKAYRDVFQPILYIHRHRTIYKKYQFYIPKIDEEISLKLSFIFNGLWLDHVYNIEPMKVHIEGKEIFQRTFLIGL